MARLLPLHPFMHSTTTPLSLETPDASTRLPPLPDRDELVRQGLPLVRSIADRLRRKYTLTASFEDLCAMGFGGLAAAADRFDPSRGASFITFAYHKIRGAILDGLRRSDRQYSFDMRCRLAAERRAAVEVADDTESFTDDDLAAEIGESVPEIASSRRHLATLRLASVFGGGDEDAPLDPDEEVYRHQVSERVREAIARLPAKEREVIELHYYSDGSFADVGDRLGISRAWASRLHKRALSALRAALVELAEEAPEARAALTKAPVGIASRGEAPEGAGVAGLELHLVRPPRAEVRGPTLYPRHRRERLDLGDKLVASSIAAVCQDDIEPARLGEEVPEAPRSLRVEGAAGGDVAGLLAPVPRLVRHGVDRPLDQDQLSVADPVLARREGSGSGLREEARDIVGAAHATEPRGVERRRRHADPLEHATCLAAARGAVEVSHLGSPEIIGLVAQVPPIDDGRIDVAAPLVGAGDEQLQRGLLAEPLVPFEERHERAAVRRRRCARVRPGAARSIPLQPQNVALRAGHRDVVAVRILNGRDEPSARKKGRHVDRLLEPFQQRFSYLHVASRIRPRSGAATCCLGVWPMRIRGSPKRQAGPPGPPDLLAGFSTAGLAVAP
jgi:RNA polymerase sigma factor for flagellar operon FliA